MLLPRGRRSLPVAGAAGSGASRLVALDGLRGAAFLAVFLFHSTLPLMPNGSLGVQVFFVLSGFLVTGLLLDGVAPSTREVLTRFWVRRAARLLPALAGLLAAVLLVAVVTADGRMAHAVLAAATSSSNLVEAWHGVVLEPLGHTWSLAQEMQFYVVWPFVVLGAARLRRGRTVLLAVALSGAVASAVVREVLLSHGALVQRLWFGPDANAEPILLGCALAVAVRERPDLVRGYAARLVAPSACLLVVLGSLPTVARFWLGPGLSLVSWASVVVVAHLSLAPATDGVVRALSARWVTALGAVSYGAYLWHRPLLLATDRFDAVLTSPVRTALVLAATLVVSGASYRWVEQPVVRAARRRGRTRTPEAAH